MKASRLIGAGMFVLLGVFLFTGALFMIGNRRLLFANRFPIYTEYARLGELQTGAVVRVAGMDAGEVTDIEVPPTASGNFRVKMQLREDLHHLIRKDSIATTQTEGLVGGIFVSISKGTDQAAEIPENGTIPSREPFSMADLLQQASDTVTMVTQTVQSLRGDAETAVQQIALTASDAHALLQEVQPDLAVIMKNAGRISTDAARISSNAQEILADINQGKGTLGKLVNDDALYVQARDIASQANAVMQNVRGVTEEARRAITDFRAKDGPAQGMLAEMRLAIDQAREATADLADNMEAMKRNFLLRGFFNSRGYYDLDSISPVEYRSGVLDKGKRKAMRIWLGADVLFMTNPDGTEVLTPGGRARIDSAMATYLEYLPTNPLIVEGYATAGSTAERFTLSRSRARTVRDYVLERYGLIPQNTGMIALGGEAPGSPTGERFDGVALTLFLDRTSLRFPIETSGVPAEP